MPSMLLRVYLFLPLLIQRETVNFFVPLSSIRRDVVRHSPMTRPRDDMLCEVDVKVKVSDGDRVTLRTMPSLTIGISILDTPCACLLVVTTDVDHV